ncbi:hypothetical protein BB560_003673, partial [Smittium megazygosporum]
MYTFKTIYSLILALFFSVFSNHANAATISAGSIINIFAPVSISNGVVVGRQTSVSVPNILSSLSNPSYKPAVYTDATISKIGYTASSVRGLTTSGFNMLSLLSGCKCTNCLSLSSLLSSIFTLSSFGECRCGWCRYKNTGCYYNLYSKCWYRCVPCSGGNCPKTTTTTTTTRPTSTTTTKPSSTTTTTKPSSTTTTTKPTTTSTTTKPTSTTTTSTRPTSTTTTPGLICDDSGYSYNDYELIDNGICVIQDIGGSESQTCYELDESVTSFIDYPYEYPDGAEGMMRRVCTIDRDADEGDQVVCETDPDAECERIGPLNPCGSLNEETYIYVNDGNLCECTNPGEADDEE